MPGYDDDDFDWDSVFGGGGYTDDELTDVIGNETDTYEQDYQGGDSDGSNWDWNSYYGDPGSYLSKFLGGFKDAGGALAKIFGGANGLGGILPLLLMGGGGLLNYNATKGASQELKDAANQGKDYAERTLGGAREDFKPYMNAGNKALDMVFSQLDQPGIAQKYLAPIKKAEPSGLKGTISLKQLMGK